MTDRTIDVNMTVISRELVSEGYTKKVECKNYWDYHGKRVEYAPTQYTFDCEKKYELYREVREYHFECVPTQTWEFLLLYVEGEELKDLGQITYFKPLKTKVKLDCCVGAG